MAFVFSHGAFAGSCGGGLIKKLIVGGWNTDDFVIMIDYQKQQSAHQGTEFAGGYIRYRKNTIPNRIEAIQSLALAAYISKTPISTYTHTNDCSNATEAAFIY